MDVSEVKKKVKDKRIQEIMWRIDHDRKNISDDEWIQFAKEMGAYVKTDIPEDVARLFYPLGYLEITTIINDGIIRRRKSICNKCRRKHGEKAYFCDIYPEEKEVRPGTGGVPAEIWAKENAQCPYFEK